MNVKQRILAIKLSEKIKKNPDLAKDLNLELKLIINNKEREFSK